MNPRALAPLSALAWLALASVAHAQSSSAQDSIDIKLLLPDDGEFRESNEIEQVEFFNYANCQCALEAGEPPGPDDDPTPGYFRIELSLSDPAASFVSDEASLEVGIRCDDEDESQQDCVDIEVIRDVEDALRSAPTYNIGAHELMFPNDTACDQTSGTRNIYLKFDVENDGIVDDQATWPYKFDTDQPPLPRNASAAGGESAINVRWDGLETEQDEVEYFQVLCARADGSPAFAEPRDEAFYDTPNRLCGGTNPDNLYPGEGSTPGRDAGPGETPDAGPGETPDAGTNVDAGFAAADSHPDWMANMDPAYVCGTRGPTAQSLRVDGLENGQVYRVALLAVDEARNVIGVDLGEVTPRTVTDFWEDYHNEGGGADGGICLVNSTFGGGSGMSQALRDFRDHTLATFALGRMGIEAYYAYVAPLGVHVEDSMALRAVAAVILAPLAGVAAFWEYTSLPVKLLVLLALVLVRRMRKQRRLDPDAHSVTVTTRPHGRFAAAAALATVLVVCASAAPAAAQGDPYWDDFGPEVEDDVVEEPVSYWNVGIKLGPYLPDIDSEFDAQPGPYERVFGGATLMGIVDVERFFLFPLGQIGVAASLGFTGQTANSFATCGPSDTGCTPGETLVDENGEPVRAPGDKTSFRLIPASIGAVYRFTYLDDQWHVPLVPYARLGLSYYLWWITAPDGSLSEYQPPACIDCDGDRALGASLGWQGSVGLAVRAERLDPQSRRSLRNELGINHAGFYAELMYADVSGFGAEGKLQVGALTWFAGLNFEF